VISTHSRIAVALAVSSLAITTACSSAQPGQASPLTTPTTHEYTKAPPVKNPLNPAKVLADPCASLTPAQKTNIGSNEAGTVENRDTGPGCSWRIGTDSSTSVGIAYLVSVKTGLSNMYALNDTGSWKNGYFEPTEIDGYPAAFADGSDLRTKGDCVLTVGITDQLFFNVVVQTRPGSDACTATRNVASKVLTTIRGRS
jgi:hypothetical protein